MSWKFWRSQTAADLDAIEKARELALRSISVAGENAHVQLLKKSRWLVDSMTVSNPQNLVEEVFMLRDQIQAFGTYFDLELVSTHGEGYAVVTKEKTAEVEAALNTRAIKMSEAAVAAQTAALLNLMTRLEMQKKARTAEKYGTPIHGHLFPTDK